MARLHGKALWRWAGGAAPSPAGAPGPGEGLRLRAALPAGDGSAGAPGAQGPALDARASQQRRIGLTGGIASGKSTVGQLLNTRFGLPVLDADRYAREVLAAGTEASAAVLARYGPAVRAGEGGAAGDAPSGTAIDRAALGRIVFADAAERQWLERLIHPQVRRRFALELARLEAAPAVVLMIPLLFEAGLQDLCSEVWLVSCDEATQRRRLMLRDGLSAAAAAQRLAAQWPLARKRALADLVIANDGSRDDLLAALGRAIGRDSTGPAPGD